jgi:hypothetical protein
MKNEMKMDLYPQATHKAVVVAKQVFNNRLIKVTTHESTRYEAKIVARELKFHLPRYFVFRIGKTVYVREKSFEGLLPLTIVAKVWEIIG